MYVCSLIVTEVLEPEASSGSPSCSTPGKTCPLAWHPHKALAAAVSDDLVHIFDMAAYTGGGGDGYKNGTSQPCGSAVTRPSIILHHGLQRSVGCVSWRPQSGSVVAVGCQGGVAVWSIGGAARAPVVASGSGSGGTGGRAPWMTFLRMPHAGGDGSRCERNVKLTESVADIDISPFPMQASVFRVISIA